MDKYFVVGENIGDSLLPFIFRHMFKAYGILAEYIPVEKDTANFPAFIKEFQENRFTGIHIEGKFRAMTRHLLEDGIASQSVGFLYYADGKYHAINKDSSTMYFIVKNKKLYGGEGKRALVLGDSNDAYDIAVKGLIDYDTVVVGKSDPIDYSKEYEIVVKATEDPEILNKLEFSLIKNVKFAVDTIYSTVDSNFIKQAEYRKIEAINGLRFFASWVAKSLEYMSGHNDSYSVVDYVYNILEEVTNFNK